MAFHRDRNGTAGQRGSGGECLMALQLKDLPALAHPPPFPFPLCKVFLAGELDGGGARQTVPWCREPITSGIGGGRRPKRRKPALL